MPSTRRRREKELTVQRDDSLENLPRRDRALLHARIPILHRNERLVQQDDRSVRDGMDERDASVGSGVQLGLVVLARDGELEGDEGVVEALELGAAR